MKRFPGTCVPGYIPSPLAGLAEANHSARASRLNSEMGIEMASATEVTLGFSGVIGPAGIAFVIVSDQNQKRA